MGGLISRPSQWIIVQDHCRDLGHTWSSSCAWSTVDLFIKVFLESIKIYLPIYLISDIIKGRSLRYILRYTLPYMLRSSLFLGVNGGFFVLFICLLRWIFGCFFFLSAGYFPGFFASLTAILIERKNRRGALTSYVATIGLECLYRIMKHRGYISPLPYGEVMLFSVGTAILIHNFKSKGTVTSLVDSLFNILFKPKLPHKIKLAITGKSGLLGNVLSFVAGTALISIWSFGLGYSVQSLLSAFQLGKRLVKNPSRLKQVLTKPYNRHFGVFLACFATFYKTLNTVLFLLSVPRGIRLYISGLAAGLSMYFVRSNSISLYTFMKALEVLYFKGVEKGILNSYYYGDVLIYSICTAMIFHTAMFEAHNLRLSYWRFIDMVTRKRIREINYDVVDIYQTESSQLHRIIRAQEEMERRRGTT